MKITQINAKSLPWTDVVTGINNGTAILEAGKPLIKILFDLISEGIKNIQTDSLSTPHGKRLAIEGLLAQIKLLLDSQHELEARIHRVELQMAG